MATGVGPPAGNRCLQEDRNYDGRGHPPIRPARPSIMTHNGGYDCEFVKRPASNLVQADCPICLLVLREPQQVTCCGYSYCRSCIQKKKDDGKPCPTCSKEFDSFPDKRLKRTLYALRFYCVHRKLGCEWEGELGELDRHLKLQSPSEKLLEGCQFSEVECILCLQPFQSPYLQAHQSDDCPKRPFACQHCNQHEATFEEVAQSHWPVCPSFPLPCPNNCNLVLQRQELEQHVRYHCPLTPVYCDFYMSGCGEVLPRRDMPSHITTNIAGHLSLLEEHMRTHPAGVNNIACMVLMVGTIQKMATENAYTRSQLHEAREELRESCDQLHQLQGSHDQLHESHDQCCNDLSSAQDRVAQLQATVVSQNEEYQRRMKENHQLANKMEKFQEKMAQLERTMTTLTTREKQEKIIDAEHVAMTQSHEMVSQQVSGLQESLAQQKDELTMMKAREEKLDKSLATTETKFQTSLATSEAKLQRSLVISEEKLQASLAKQQTMITECSNDSRKLSQTINEQERKRQENEATVMALKDDFSHKLAASEQNIRDQEAALTLHQQTLERVTCTGELPFDFTMTEFKSKKKNDVDWYSPPFYTHSHGYRMCIRVDANGCGDGEGTHLSVYAYLMQGPYDDDLMWPFQGVITVQHLNQLEDGNHRIYTINFTGNTLPIAMNRVTSGERAGSGCGTHTSLPHTQLELNSKGNCQYLKDDQLKFRVSKATNLHLTSHIHRRCLKLESFTGAIEPQVAVAPIEFTLSDFEQQKNQDSVWISPAFYTHQRGYRICLQVHPNGRGDVQGTHVSIYTCLMRGPFDGGLKWPFRGDVTIQIVDQAGEKHHEMVVRYNNNTPDSHANRVTEGEWSLGWCYQKFLPHTSLGYNTATNTQYLQANSLQIRISKVKIKN